MVAKNLLDDVLSLPLENRFEIFERLRENLQGEPDVHRLTPEQRLMLQERNRESHRNPDDGYSIEQVEEMLQRRRRA